MWAERSFWGPCSWSGVRSALVRPDDVRGPRRPRARAVAHFALGKPGSEALYTVVPRADKYKAKSLADRRLPVRRLGGGARDQGGVPCMGRGDAPAGRASRVRRNGSRSASCLRARCRGEDATSRSRTTSRREATKTARTSARSSRFGKPSGAACITAASIARSRAGSGPGRPSERFARSIRSACRARSWSSAARRRLSRSIRARRRRISAGTAFFELARRTQPPPGRGAMVPSVVHVNAHAKFPGRPPGALAGGPRAGRRRGLARGRARGRRRRRLLRARRGLQRARARRELRARRPRRDRRARSTARARARTSRSTRWSSRPSSPCVERVARGASPPPGVDAIIVQDPAVALLARARLPGARGARVARR